MHRVYPEPLTRLIDQLQAPARHRREERAAARVSHSPDAARRCRTPDRRHPRRQGARDLLLGLQQHHRRRSVRVLQLGHPRSPAHLRGRGAAERHGDREDARFQGRVSRADGRAVAAAGDRPGRAEDQEPARARRRGRASRKSSLRPIRTSKARRPRSTWRGC